MTEPRKLAQAQMFTSVLPSAGNPWSTTEVDKMEVKDLNTFAKIVDACRFFYRHDSIVSSVINKSIDIGINDLVFDSKDLTSNAKKVVEGLLPELHDFAETMALEFLVSGLVVPEIKYANVTRDQLKEMSIKKFETLVMPVAMWVRDPTSIKINYTMVMDKPSYYVKVPEKLIQFILGKGTYADGTKDPELYAKLKAYYPEFILKVEEKQEYILIEDDSLIFRNRPISDSPYPTPYLYAALEPLKHKRNLRRMDYSIAARVIGAIQLFRLGNDEFPVTEDQDGQFQAIKDQMYWRLTSQKDIERIFQLFANHTLQIDWIFPPVEALLNENKYKEVNEDIMIALGFPKILITGEVTKTGTSNPEFATMAPTKTLEAMRKRILRVLNRVIDVTFEENGFSGDTTLKFTQMNLSEFSTLVEGLTKLYNTGNLSRKSYSGAFGYDIEEEMKQRSDEKELLTQYGLDEFNPQPFTPSANNNNTAPPSNKPKINPQENQKNPQK